jgi:hypothetical protein
MRGKSALVLLALAMVSCSKDWTKAEAGIDYNYGRNIPHGRIVLGDRLENPYTTANITKALECLYPTKADRVDVKTTNLYVRFLPQTDEEYELLAGLGLHLTDHPLDYAIAVEGDWYHDPEIPEGRLTWQYAVVPADYDFPDIRYEIIDECHISENDPGTRADGIDWEAVERQSYILTGNGDRLAPALTKASEKLQPSGRITIEDPDFNGGKPFGVAGVRVSCNSFVKFDHCHTDRDGYYQMEKSFASDLRYRLVFQNSAGFSIGLNLVLVPASVSTLGKSGPEGVNLTVTEDSDDRLYRRCVVNNAAYEYISRCTAEDLGIASPPSDLRIWLFNSLEVSSSVMLHHGAVLRSDLVQGFLGKSASILEYFLPDITIGTKRYGNYAALYSEVCHEMAHATHFKKVGTSYWDQYIAYIIESFVKSAGQMYGDGVSPGSGHCEVGEMWAYYLESKLYKERYGGPFPTFGTGSWFYPQIFRFMDDRGLNQEDIFSVLDEEVDSKDKLKKALVVAFPEKDDMIEQVFSRY